MWFSQQLEVKMLVRDAGADGAETRANLMVEGQVVQSSWMVKYLPAVVLN